MAQRVYIETTFVSYLTARPSRDVVTAGHQQTTHEWWDTQRKRYELCISQLVLQIGRFRRQLVALRYHGFQHFRRCAVAGRHLGNVRVGVLDIHYP